MLHCRLGFPRIFYPVSCVLLRVATPAAVTCHNKATRFYWQTGRHNSRSVSCFASPRLSLRCSRLDCSLRSSCKFVRERTLKGQIALSSSMNDGLQALSLETRAQLSTARKGFEIFTIRRGLYVAVAVLACWLVYYFFCWNVATLEQSYGKPLA